MKYLTAALLVVLIAVVGAWAIVDLNLKHRLAVATEANDPGCSREAIRFGCRDPRFER